MPGPSLPSRRRLPLVEIVAVAVVVACLVGRIAVWTPRIAVDLLFQTFTVVGVLLRIRRPGNVIGTLFLIAGVAAAVSAFGDAVISADRADPHFADWQIQLVAAFQAIGWFTTIVMPLVFVTLLFPDGKPISARWAIVVRVTAWAVVGTLVALVALAYASSRAQNEAPDPVFHGTTAFIANLVFVGILVTVAATIAGTVSLVIRYRRGTPEARQQLKFVIYAAAVAFVCSLVQDSAGPLRNVLTAMGETLIALAVGLAILRYRLYDIDRVVSRTVTYAIVTGSLVAAYLAVVSVTTGALGLSTSFGVAASTLAAAAAFTPLRRTVQSRVDRRFNRERYDAARTVDRFATRLRDSVDLATVSTELGDVVHSTMQPTTVSLWLQSSTT